MVLSDFLSRQHRNNSNPHEILPISFKHGENTATKISKLFQNLRGAD